jgi:hypothetical protein
MVISDDVTALQPARRHDDATTSNRRVLAVGVRATRSSGSRSHEVILRRTNARRLWPRTCTSGDDCSRPLVLARKVADAGAATGAHEDVGRNEYIVT